MKTATMMTAAEKRVRRHRRVWRSSGDDRCRRRLQRPPVGFRGSGRRGHVRRAEWSGCASTPGPWLHQTSLQNSSLLPHATPTTLCTSTSSRPTWTASTRSRTARPSASSSPQPRRRATTICGTSPSASLCAASATTTTARTCPASVSYPYTITRSATRRPSSRRRRPLRTVRIPSAQSAPCPAPTLCAMRSARSAVPAVHCAPTKTHHRCLNPRALLLRRRSHLFQPIRRRS